MVGGQRGKDTSERMVRGKDGEAGCVSAQLGVMGVLERTLRAGERR